MSDFQGVITQFASLLETESNSVDIEVGTTTIGEEVRSEKEYKNIPNSVKPTEVDFKRSVDCDQVSETQGNTFGDAATETEGSTNASDSSETLDIRSGNSTTGSLDMEGPYDESVTGQAELKETTAQSLDPFTDSEIDSKDPQTESAILET